MQHSPKVIVFLYNRLFDPLMQSNFWLYIADILRDPERPYQVHVITYEDPAHPLEPYQEDLWLRWQSLGLGWTRLTWHRGTGLRSKLIDVVNGFLAVARLRARGYKSIVSLGSVAGAFAYLYARVLGMRLFLYQYEPHSEYAIDNKMWGPTSLQYRIANRLERWSAEYASVIASGTRFMQTRLETEWRVKGKFLRIATVADDRKFTFDQQIRDVTRAELGLENRWVLVYPGKFGDLYYREPFAWMFRWLKELEPRLHMLIVTPHSDQEVHGLFQKANVDPCDYTIIHCDFAEIHRYYFAADFGIISVPPGPSKRFISNIKVGEYLCAGLPYLITRGVSEDYLYATEKNVGVVVNDFREGDVKAAWPEMRALLTEDVRQRRDRCRAFGLEYRGFDSLNPVFRQAMKIVTNTQG